MHIKFFFTIMDLLVLFHQIPNFSYHPNTVKCPIFKNPTSFYFLSHTLKTKQILSKIKERGFVPFDLKFNMNLMIDRWFLLDIVNVKIDLVLIRINRVWFWFLMGDFGLVWVSSDRHVCDGGLIQTEHWFLTRDGWVCVGQGEGEGEWEWKCVAEVFRFCCSRTWVI